MCLDKDEDLAMNAAWGEDVELKQGPYKVVSMATNEADVILHGAFGRPAQGGGG